MYEYWHLGSETLVMGVFSRVKADGMSEYAVANKGTYVSSVSEWVQNILQSVGWSKDAPESIAYATSF